MSSLVGPTFYLKKNTDFCYGLHDLEVAAKFRDYCQVCKIITPIAKLLSSINISLHVLSYSSSVLCSSELTINNF